MSYSVSIAASRCCRNAFNSRRTFLSRPVYSSSTDLRSKRKCIGRRLQSTDASPIEPSSPKITSLVDQISQLTLLETADLVASLKSHLKIPDMSFAPPMAAGAQVAASTAPAVDAEEEAPLPAAQEKTLFTLKLQSFDPSSKPKVIKEVKSMLGLSLVESKKFVESAPKMLKEGLTQGEAQKIMESMKALGAVVTMD